MLQVWRTCWRSEKRGPQTCTVPVVEEIRCTLSMRGGLWGRVEVRRTRSPGLRASIADCWEGVAMVGGGGGGRKREGGVNV